MSTWKELKDNPQKMAYYQKRLALVKAVREFFWAENFLEVETPLAVKYPGQEPHLNPVPLPLHDPSGQTYQYYLHTSPEFSMKKLLASGLGQIFQITKTFRDYENFGGLHNPEFTMLEWYRGPGTYQDIMTDIERLFKFVAATLGKDKIKGLGEKWDKTSMKVLWEKYLGVSLDKNLSLSEIKATAHQQGHKTNEKDAYEDVFFRIFLNEIEPKLGLEKPLFVYDYPLQMCSLSQTSKTDARYGERFELYINSLEIANGFGELTAAIEQRHRLETDRKRRQQLGKPTWGIDEDFIAALESGIGVAQKEPAPPKNDSDKLPVDALTEQSATAAGVALGVDRMVMLFTGAGDIKEVIFE